MINALASACRSSSGAWNIRGRVADGVAWPSARPRWHFKPLPVIFRTCSSRRGWSVCTASIELPLSVARAKRLRALGMAIVLAGLGVLLSAVQWVPSKELLDRSPRAGGALLGGPDFRFVASRAAADHRRSRSVWHARPRYGLDGRILSISRDEHVPGADRDRAGDHGGRGQGRARPLGDVLGFARGARRRAHARANSRFSSTMHTGFRFWGARASRCDSISGWRWRPQRLRPSGVERLQRDAGVSLRPGLVVAVWLILLSIPILGLVYSPVWKQLSGSVPPRNLLQFRWLGRELLIAVGAHRHLVRIGLVDGQQGEAGSHPHFSCALGRRSSASSHRRPSGLALV